MKTERYALGAAASLALLLIFAATTVYGAVKYKDVPENYWAFNEINDVSDRGFMVGDASGNFRPGDPIDKFETARILAKIMGYKYTGVTGSELLYYKQAYEKNAAVIAQYAAPYVKWKSAYNYEIAYLLEKEILTVEDLSQFVVKDGNGVQQYRALSRQEAAVYLVKIMGLKTEALSEGYDAVLNDDADIKKAYKPYVYCLYGIGVLTKDDSGKFRPNDMVSRASLAVMLSDSLAFVEKKTGPDTGPQAAQAPAAVDNTRVASLTGYITKIYADLGSIELTSGSAAYTYEFAPEAAVYVDSFLKTKADLKEGMPANAVLSGGQIIQIYASGSSPGNAAVPVSNMTSSSVEGTVSDIRADSPAAAVDLSLAGQEGKPGGSKTFVLDKNCKITRNGAGAALSDVKPGDMVLANICGGICLGLDVESALTELVGAIQEIHITSSEQSLAVKTDAGDQYTLYVNPGKTDIYSFRVGMRIHFNIDKWKILAVEILNQ